MFFICRDVEYVMSFKNEQFLVVQLRIRPIIRVASQMNSYIKQFIYFDKNMHLKLFAVDGCCKKVELLRKG